MLKSKGDSSLCVTQCCPPPSLSFPTTQVESLSIILFWAAEGWWWAWFSPSWVQPFLCYTESGLWRLKTTISWISSFCHQCTGYRKWKKSKFARSVITGFSHVQVQADYTWNSYTTSPNPWAVPSLSHAFTPVQWIEIWAPYATAVSSRVVSSLPHWSFRVQFWKKSI